MFTYHKNRFIYTLNLLSVLFFYTNTSVAQTSGTTEVNTNLNGAEDHDFEARDKVVFKVGAKYKPSAISNKLNARVNDRIILPVDINNTNTWPSRAALNSSLEVGSTSGQASVNALGQAVYQIPVFTPPGIGTVVPQVSIMYQSGSTRGLVGYGWDITGLSGISRAGNNIYYKSYTTPVRYTNEDRFVLDGENLEVISGTHGHSSSVYGTESETFSDIVSHGLSGNGPMWFEVKTKNGLTIEYGNTPDSRLTTGDNTVLQWRINKIMDNNGNYMVYTYVKENNQIAISQIKYTANDAAGVSFFNEINFYYDKRPDACDEFIGGFKITYALLLREVRVQNEGVIARSYQFKYAKAHHTKLVEVIEKGKTNETYNSTLIQWGNDDMVEDIAANDTYIYNTSPVTRNIGPLARGDFDGDGRTDMLFSDAHINATNPFFSYISSRGSNVLWMNTQVSSLNYAGISVIDFDDNGSDEIYFIKASNPNLYNVVGYKFQNGAFVLVNNALTALTFNSVKSAFGGAATVEEFAIVPVNYSGNSGDLDYFVIRTIVETGLRPKQAIVSVLYNPAILDPSNQLRLVLQRSIRLMDFNSDGKTDILDVNEVAVANSITLSVQSYNHGSYTPSYANATLIKDFDYFDVGDFNGDGNSDILAHSTPNSQDPKIWSIFHSTGTSYVSDFPELTDLNNVSSQKQIRVIDINNDGKSDIAYFTNWTGGGSTGQFNYLRSYGNGFELKTFFNFPHNAQYLQYDLIDFDGNAIADLCYYNGLYYKIRKLIKGEQTNMVIGIINGYNNTSTFEYEFNATLLKKIYQHDKVLDAPNKLYGLLHTPRYLVKTLKKLNANQLAEQVSLTYNNAVYNKEGKGFLGFKTITSTKTWNDNFYGIREITEKDLHPSYAFLFTNSIRQQTISGNNQVADVSLTSFVYEDAPGISGYKRFWHRPKRVETENFITGITSVADYITYDSYGNLTEQEEYNINGGKITTTTSTYIAAGALIPNKLLSQVVRIRDTRPNPNPDYLLHTNYTYTSSGQLEQSILEQGTPKEVTTALEYNLCGLPKKSTITSQGLPSRTEQWVYDAKYRFPIEIRNTLNQKVEKTYDPVFGTVHTETNINGKKSSFVYNGFGRMLQSTDPFGNVTTYTRQWVSSSVAGSVFMETISTPDLPTAKVWYNNLSQKIKSSTINASNQELFIDYSFNLQNQLVSQSKPYTAATTTKKYTTYQYDYLNRLHVINDGYGKKTLMRYDMQNLPAGISLPANAAYAVRSTNMIDPANENATQNPFKITAYNKDNEVCAVFDNISDIQYENYPNGQLKQTTVAGAVTSFTYDVYGNRTQMTEPNAGTIVSAYNNYGQLTQQTDASGNASAYTYDVAGRVLQKTVTAQNAPTPVVTSYSYINSGSGLNQVKTITSPDVSQTYTYNSFGQLTQLSENSKGSTFNTYYTYDSKGYNTSVTYPSGFGIKYEYAKGLLKRINKASDNSRIWEAITYNFQNQLTKATLGANLSYVYDYDALSGYSPKEERLELDPNNIKYQYKYGFDYATGNMEWQKNEKAGLLETYTYDVMERLTSVDFTSGVNQPVQTLSMNYQSNGNILNKSDVSASNYIYNTSPPHAVASIPSPFITVPSLNQNITFNAAQRPVSIQHNTDEMTLIYGPDDERRITYYSQNGQLHTTHFYSGNYEKEITAGSTKEYHYIYAGKGLAAIMIKTGSTENMYYTCTNHLGTINALVSSTGTIAEEYSTDAWGRRRNPTDWSYTNITTPALINRSYTGHEHLDAFGLINMNARLYDPVIGRMLSPDNYLQDAANGQNYNRYTYVLNNPLKFTDPTGNEIEGGPGQKTLLPYAQNDFYWGDYVGFKQRLRESGIYDEGVGYETGGGSTIAEVSDEGDGGGDPIKKTPKPNKINKGQAEILPLEGAYEIYSERDRLTGRPIPMSGLEQPFINSEDFFTLGVSLIPKLAVKGGVKLAIILAAIIKTAPKGISVIGPRTTYRQFAKSISANFLDVTDDAWTWAKNQKFLDGVILRGDDVIFAGKFNPSKLDPNSILAQEIKYLIEGGYKWTDDYFKLVKTP